MTSKKDIKTINLEALDQLPCAAIVFDNDQIYYINDTGLNILNVKNKNLFFKSKKRIFDFLLPEFHESIRKTIILEITKRKKYEKELLESGELFNVINKHSNDIFFKFDFYPQPKYAFLSDSLHEILG